MDKSKEIKDKSLDSLTNETLVIAGTYDGGIIGLNLKFNEKKIFNPVFSFKAHLLTVKDIDSNNNILITASADETMKIYNLKTRCDVGILNKHEGTINSIRISNNCKYLLSCAEDKTICLWKCANWELILTLNNIYEFKPVSSDFHPSMRLAITIDINCNIYLINLLQGKLATKFTIPIIKDNCHINKKYGLFQFVKFNYSGEYYCILSQKLIIISSIIKDNWFIYLYTQDFQLGNIQFTTFQWLNNESIIVGLSNGDIKLFYINKDSLLSIEIQFENNNQDSQLILNPHKNNRIKGIHIFNNHLNQNSYFNFSGHLITCDSLGIFVIYNYYFLQKENKKKFILKILDIYDSETRITCMTIQRKIIQDFNFYQLESKNQIKKNNKVNIIKKSKNKKK